ncbi:uncharacterized protein C8A04DRAFT_14028 [Dichotomopilus funicola]|uniref:Uncharacterized protein n=1 Tax=Dichotomopilus funicola TaxID=1934379 RepID=A0AAN6UYR5_9PEZI|nr:hypothetical protein C8A04DRAFT_14028 [Dichotomopilus funicola]
MPTIAQIRASNAQISTALPPGLVAVFAGATNGIGESALLQFAKNTVKPRIYFFGRSQEAGERVLASLQKINPDGEYIFKAVDLSLLSAVDEVSREIREKEKVVNLLFLSTGTLVTGKETSENLHLPFATAFFSRLRLTTNLLPLLRAPSTSPNTLRRVVTVLAGTKEGPLLSLPPKPESKSTAHDLQLRAPTAPSLLTPRGRGHTVTLTTLALEAIAKEAPEVGFVHDFPGAVRSNLGRDLDGWGWKVALGLVHGVVYPVLGLVGGLVPVEEAGERQVYFGTSGRFPGGGDNKGGDGVPGGEGGGVAVGTDGKVGSGVYSVTEAGESAGEKVVELLGGYRRDGTAEAVWKWVEKEFVRITGGVSI